MGRPGIFRERTGDSFITYTRFSDEQASSTSTGGTVSSADDYIKKLVDSAPPLTPEQRNRLAVLLRPDIQPQPDEVTKPAITVGDIVDDMTREELASHRKPSLG